MALSWPIDEIQTDLASGCRKFERTRYIIKSKAMSPAETISIHGYLCDNRWEGGCYLKVSTDK
jgi:hypothetical protein